DDADQAGHVSGGEIDHGPLEQRPDALRWIHVRRVRGQPVHPQPGLILCCEARQLRGQVDVEVIPDPDQGRGQLAVRGDDQVPVVLPGKPFRLALAAPADPQLEEQVRPVTGPVAGHPGDADPPAARAGTWADQPCRRSSLLVPSMVYTTWNSFPMSVLILPRVHRWSLANPCASGPFRSSSSSRAHCCGLSRSRDTGPLDRSASSPPSRQARCHRRTDPSVTRRSRAISPIASPRTNRPAASIRSRSRRCCSAGVYPPRCAYRMHPSYARDRPTSRPALYEFTLVTGMIGHYAAEGLVI